MPHFPKPFFRPKKNRWYVQIQGKQINLGPDQDKAFQAYHQLMSEEKCQTSPLPSLAVSEICSLFLNWTQRHREGRTGETYQERIQSFLDFLGPDPLLAQELKPFHLQRWVDSHPSWNPGMKRGRLQSVQRAFNWAVQQGYLEASPIRHLQKPPQGKRENLISFETYQKMLDLSGNLPFRDLLVVCWETGCRPQEVWKVTRFHLDIPGKRWVFPVKESKGKRKIRIVYLTETALDICKRLAQDHLDGPLFLNSEGRPWNKSSSSCCFLRMKKALGKKYALVDFRHSFTTRALIEGVDPVTLSFLLGHADTSMLAKVYAHLDQEVDHLRKALDKIK